jgi:uncharacterized membrane protein YfcA
MDLLHGSSAFVSAFAAGAINSVAGGGTLLTFPTLIWLGLNSVSANATSTVAIWPGSLGGVWGFRSNLRTADRRLLALTAPSLAGGIAGALLLRFTPPSIFDAVVPFLILFATLLFMVQETVQRMFKTGEARHESARWLAGAMLFQFFVALYGGYFGAGIGILMLAALGILGLTDLHQMNGLKNFFALSINGVAAIYFMFAHMVEWPYVLIMAVGAIAGGVGGAGLARRLGRMVMRRVVIAIGFAMALSLFLKWVLKRA